MRILLAGATGQVGHELLRSLQKLGGTATEIIAPGRDRFDLSDPAQCRRFIHNTKPALIVNAAAYTDVDRAESESAMAMRLNADAPAVMAEEAARIGAALVHFSTDYVFDGKASLPYREQDPVGPVNAYGRTKLAGEQAIVAAGIPHLILRTGWVYGMRGRNFLRSILHLARTQDTLRVVDDQFGTPTWCRTVADMTAQLLAMAQAAPNTAQWWKEHGGLLHMTAIGSTSRADFARRIIELAGLSAKAKVEPVSTASYPTVATRPRYSVLDTGKLQGLCMPPRWDEALQRCMQQSG
ncbi:MAG TPA: dTDP-4-dehydrorhamnose reductase [Noviherbaspirillum sp.]|jgi:dTDP-4-dehydrorhamnose reductase|uniref:dTDP-4-dehydrorhamnose reductase n=1 Tax=Noviherbaspirillum sp. TaxID=1926288 RepID=UPI002DDD78BB|nr:dTDP-4-dehydrorhamnose reductase [Noviherbaspirillum sp.]HEV2609966.1 dTDP-4-dehydrorhamnose reductase [Noviherbaspirillum sp.]